MKGEVFVKLPRDLLESDAFGAIGSVSFRLLRFLMIEHMRHGGKRNGFLLAPRRQLVEAGIRPHDISAAIEELRRLGIIDCRPGTGRRPSVYALTWLPLSDGTGPAQMASLPSRSRRYRRTKRAGKTTRGKAVASTKPHSQGQPVASAKPHSQKMSAVWSCKGDQTALTKPVVSTQTALTMGGTKQHSPSRTLSGSYHGGAGKGSEGATGYRAAAGSPAGCYVVGEHGFRICGSPLEVGGRGTEHALPLIGRPDPLVSQ